MRIATRYRKLAAAVALACLNALPAWGLDLRDCDRPDLDRRIAACTAILHRDKDKAAWGAAYSNRAGAFRDKGDYDRALADFDMAVQLNPEVAAFWMNRGGLWTRRENFDRAIADLTKAIQLDPLLWKSFNNRSVAWKAKGEYTRAKDDIDQAIRLAPNEPLPHAHRAGLWRLLGDLDAAIADLNKAIAVIPPKTSPRQSPMALILTNRGDVWRYRGEFDRALADYTEASRYADGYALAYIGRGLTYERMGDPVRARAEFEMALQKPTFGNDSNKSAQDTARARLAALDSGMEQPSIPAAPRKAANQTSIPTPSPAAPTIKPAISQGRRVALVIGNSSYRSVPALTNPQKDAEAIAASLRNIGFQTVTLAADATREKLLDALRNFTNEAEKTDWAMVYYAGHGIEVNGQNYLIPVDAKLATDRDIQFEAIPLDQVLASLEGARKLKLVLLDACRDNPFMPQMRKTVAPDAAAVSTAGGNVGTRSIGRGLGEVKVQGASLVVFAAKHGQTALDGEGGNSPFAVAMVQRIATLGVEINKIFRLVRDDVMEATAGRQEPYTYGSLPGKEDFFFVAK
jgi:tetratricopeptide (TPR) repeat protein